ncbi:hypothetical protein BP6252_10472 [Coleophoma cylindrospora]|uniref:NTF2 domain-containing protein n=1 Tax=Coleophoma cylindrospora TaxID=1849047 RepID=A0A3D8QT02_9HELO|nr:hypothetical protein BP6252_10472 [Coleophoma cylindrospora]
MSNPSEDVEVKASSEGAQNFVDSYYAALNSTQGRTGLTKFYIKPTPTAPAEADISMNGNVFANPSELQDLFEKQVTKAQYDVHSFDCQVINRNYNVGADESMLGPDKDGKKMSLLVLVSGAVKYGEDGDERGFTESFILVPNWDALGPKAPKGLKKFLVASQNFRILV